ncbi:mobile element protein [Streptomyces sp. NL15-2K]|nr:hypothetical protein [Kutzneria buriramensis]WKX12671.1 hypothetical protein Q4V64_36190 [Kutzneria buriramensis]GCB43117.1 mobile element protein [Streptomyces sp. NL15-2K]
MRRLTDQEGQKLQQIVRRGSTSSVRYRRAMMLLASAGGNRVPVIAQLVQADEDTLMSARLAGRRRASSRVHRRRLRVDGEQSRLDFGGPAPPGQPLQPLQPRAHSLHLSRNRIAISARASTICFAHIPLPASGRPAPTRSAGSPA